MAAEPLSRALLFIPTAILLHSRQATRALPGKIIDVEPHNFGDVPMVEYWNNSEETGDFEQVISLIDAYDTLESDRINDKTQFTDALLGINWRGRFSIC